MLTASKVVGAVSLPKIKETMKKSLKFWSLVLLCWGITACDKNFLDVNDDPNSATKVSPDLLFSNAAINLGSNNTIEIGPPTNFFAQCWSAGGSAGVFTSPERYIISSNTVGNSWITHYLNAIKNLYLGIDNAEKGTPANPNAAAQCKILAAVVHYYNTVLWEKVPFKEAGKPNEFPTPKFDEQADVLKGCIALLDEALKQIVVESPLKITTNDLYYNGDMTKWAKLAKSLKFRIMMVMSDADASVRPQLADMVAKGGMIGSATDDFQLPYFNKAGTKNPYWQLHEQYSSGESGFFFGGEIIVNLLNKLEDPRRDAFLQIGEDAEPDVFIGVAPGSNALTISSPINIKWLRADAPNQMFTYYEQLLLEAEAILKGYVPGGVTGADAKMRAAIKASMDYYGVTVAKQNTYIAMIPKLNAISSAEALNTLYQQEYIAMFGRGIDAWTNWRRTEVPELILPPNALSAGIIRRIPYSTAEVTANPNTPKEPAIDAKMWFDK